MEASYSTDNPSKENFDFGWDTDFSNVTDDLTVTAEYNQTMHIQSVIYEINSLPDNINYIMRQ